MKFLFLAIGLVLATEGALYALFPNVVKTMIMRIGEVAEDKLRIVGLLALIVGVFLVWVGLQNKM